MAKKRITETVREILSDYLSDNGYELYRTEYIKEGRDWFLRVYIDRIWDDEHDRVSSFGISTDDCEKVSKYLSGELDRVDLIEHNYYLEVSSPGLDRELIEDRDFIRFAGQKVTMKLYQAFDGHKKLEGILEGLENNSIMIKDNQGDTIAVPRSLVAKVKLEIVI